MIDLLFQSFHAILVIFKVGPREEMRLFAYHYMNEHQPTPEEYRELEGITPEFEAAAEHHLLPNSDESIDELDDLVERKISDRPHPELLKHVLDDENITAELERAKEYRVLLNEVSRIYQKIGDLVRGKSDPLSTEASRESSHAWEALNRLWGEFKKKEMSEEQMVGALKAINEFMLDTYHRLQDKA